MSGNKLYRIAAASH